MNQSFPDGPILLLTPLNGISPSDIPRPLRRRNQFLCMDQVRSLIHNLIFNMHIPPNHRPGQNHTVFNNSALLDGASPSDHRILYSSFYQTSVRHNRGLNGSRLEILRRTRVVRPCIDRPFLVKQIHGILIIYQRHICVIIALKVSN